MQFTIARLTIEGITFYSQSRQHEEPWLERESHDDYDKRTWRSKLNVETVNGKPSVVIPAHGFHQCVAASAKYSKRKIKGQGGATWTGKFTSGIMLMENPPLLIDPSSVESITINANADGVRGSGKRVRRRFPQMPPIWRATFDVHVLDPIITESIFAEMVEMGGMFIGLGRFRPEKGGTNGRFRIGNLVWQDNRSLAA